MTYSTFILIQWCTGCVNWPDLAGVHGEETIEEDKNANQGGRNQHAGVPAQPCKVKTDFLTKVTSRRQTEKQCGQNPAISCCLLIKPGHALLQQSCGCSYCTVVASWIGRLLGWKVTRHNAVVGTNNSICLLNHSCQGALEQNTNLTTATVKHLSDNKLHQATFICVCNAVLTTRKDMAEKERSVHKSSLHVHQYPSYGPWF